MEHRLELDPGRDLIIVGLSGDFDPEAIRAVVTEMLAHPEYRSNMSALYDLRGLSFGAISADELQRLSFEIADPSWDGTRLAFVADDDDVFGLARVYCTVAGESGDQQRRTFRDYDVAERWVLEG